jgi:hypothetical protein
MGSFYKVGPVFVNAVGTCPSSAHHLIFLFSNSGLGKSEETSQ